jgi:hypothetical protein
MYHSVLGGYQFHLALPVVNGEANFLIEDPKEALRRLKRLQDKFGVPQYAIDRLQSEVDELEKEKSNE